MARPRGHAPARRPDVGRRRALHLSARSLVGPRLVAHATCPIVPASRTGSTRPSISTRSRSAAATATSRRSSRSPCRRKTTSRCGGCRSPTAARGRARSRSRATPKSCWHARGRSRASGVRQAVRRDRVRCAERRAAVQPAAAGGRRVARSWASTCSASTAGVWRRGRMGDRPRALPRPRPLAGQPGRARRPRAVGHDRRRARSDWRAARARAAGARRVVRVTFATGVAADRDSGAGARAQVPRRQRRRARLLDGVHARAHHAAAPRPHRRSGDALRSAGVARVRRGRVAASARPISRATRSASRTCGATASPAICRSCSSASPTPTSLPLVAAAAASPRSTGASKGLRADVVILNEHPADYLDEMQQLAHALVQEPPWAGWIGKPGGMFLLRADGMPDADRRLLRRGRARRPARRSRRAVARSWIVRRRGCTTSTIVPAVVPRSRRPNRPRHRSPCRRSSWRTGSAASRPTAASTSSCSKASARRRCRGRTCSPTRVRHDRQQRRLGVHLGGQQPREPADAVRQRSAHRSDGRGDLSCATRSPARCGARRRLRCRGDQTAGRWVVRHAAGVTRYQHAVAGLEQELAVFVAPEDPVKLARADADQHVDERAAPQRVRLRRVVPRPAARRRAPVRRDRASTRRPARSSRATPTTRSSRGASRSCARPSRRDRSPCDRTEFIGRNRTLAGAGGALPRAAGRPHRRRPRPVRRAAVVSRARAGRVAPASRSCSARGATARTRPTRRRATAIARGGGRGARRDRARLGRDARRRPGAHAGRFVRSDRQPLAAVPDAQLPHLGAERARISPAARSGSAISCRTCWRCSYARPELCRAHICCTPRRGSSSKATCSTGGIRRAAAARGRAARTICSGCRTSSAQLRIAQPATSRCSTSRCRSSRRRRSSLARRRRTCLPRVSSEIGVALRALRPRDRARRSKYGAHGLPLIGSGDWNDGMNRVGHEGRGESVWLGWFLVTVLNDVRADLRAPRPVRSRAAATATRRGGSRACSSSPGTATGIAAPISTTARRWDRCRTRSAGSIR